MAHTIPKVTAEVGEHSGAPKIVEGKSPVALARKGAAKVELNEVVKVLFQEAFKWPWVYAIDKSGGDIRKEEYNVAKNIQAYKQVWRQAYQWGDEQLTKPTEGDVIAYLEHFVNRAKKPYKNDVLEQAEWEYKKAEWEYKKAKEQRRQRELKEEWFKQARGKWHKADKDKELHKAKKEFEEATERYEQAEKELKEATKQHEEAKKQNDEQKKDHYGQAKEQAHARFKEAKEGYQEQARRLGVEWIIYFSTNYRSSKAEDTNDKDEAARIKKGKEVVKFGDSIAFDGATAGYKHKFLPAHEFILEGKKQSFREIFEKTATEMKPECNVALSLFGETGTVGSVFGVPFAARIVLLILATRNIIKGYYRGERAYREGKCEHYMEKAFKIKVRPREKKYESLQATTLVFSKMVDEMLSQWDSIYEDFFVELISDQELRELESHAGELLVVGLVLLFSVTLRIVEDPPHKNLEFVQGKCKSFMKEVFLKQEGDWEDARQKIKQKEKEKMERERKREEMKKKKDDDEREEMKKKKDDDERERKGKGLMEKILGQGWKGKERERD